MKKWLRQGAAVPASVCLGAVILAGQAPGPAAKVAPSNPQATPAQEPDSEAARIVLDVTRVNVLFTVTDKKGRFITDLGRDDFEVYEKKKEQKIVQFSAESDLPLRLALLIDTSNSIRDRFRFEQQAAADFINSTVRPKADRAMLVSFDSSTELVADLTDDTEKLDLAVKSLRPGGGTSLYDAVFYACRDKLQLDQPRDKFRRALVVVSDGEDTQSRMSRDQALEAAQKADVVIYAISTNRSKIDQDGDKVLKYLTEETGGQAFFPFEARDLTQSFENIANELRHQYNVFYRPQPLDTDGMYHPITIKVKGHKDFIVRARKGYYAPKL